MRWTPAVGELRDLLAELYSDDVSARPVVTDVGLKPTLIRFSGSAVGMWQAILEEAAKQDRVLEIIARARKDYPQQSKLDTLAQTIQAESKEQASDKTPPPATVTPNDLRKFIAAQFKLAELEGVLADLSAKLQAEGKMEGGQPANITLDSLGGQTIESVALNLVTHLQRRGWFDYLPPIVRSYREDEFDAKFGANG
jgi:hypothetical protein